MPPLRPLLPVATSKFWLTHLLSFTSSFFLLIPIIHCTTYKLSYLLILEYAVNFQAFKQLFVFLPFTKYVHILLKV